MRKWDKIDWWFFGVNAALLLVYLSCGTTVVGAFVAFFNKDLGVTIMLYGVIGLIAALLFNLFLCLISE